MQRRGVRTWQCLTVCLFLYFCSPFDDLLLLCHTEYLILILRSTSYYVYYIWSVFGLQGRIQPGSIPKPHGGGESSAAPPPPPSRSSFLVTPQLATVVNWSLNQDILRGIWLPVVWQVWGDRVETQSIPSQVCLLSYSLVLWRFIGYQLDYRPSQRWLGR